ncbi:MAG: T9SS type A sorting domain-containing protein [Bacteroidetes bacterium]|nr:T9SS type A sorting domain-containing protein [Bacteroidota bacterium]
MKVALAAFLLIFLLSSAYASKSGKGKPTDVSGRKPAGLDYAAPHAYNVLDYKLFMDWYGVLKNLSPSYDGIMQVTFKADSSSPISSIRLDYGPQYLFVDSAFSESKRVTVSSSDGFVRVSLYREYSYGDTGTVTLYYHVNNPGVANNDQQRGFYIYYPGEEVSGQSVPHTVAYTMSEPSDARYWMPCYDDPSDKALCQISIRVPDGFVAASNGTLISKVNNGDGSTTFNWSEDYPVSTYLMCATAAKFAVIQRMYVENDGVSIPVQYYVYPEDSAAAVSNAECNIDTVISMLKFYSSLYGPYPFDKYGMTGIEPFHYGGMEHQTITTLRRSYEFNRRVVAHELAHQWWGDMVTLGTWKDIWLNEGFATYSELMQLQHLSQASFEDELNFYADQFFAEDSTIRYPVYAPPPGYIFGLGEYYKGAWVLHMLRNIVGDSTFFAIFKSYRSAFAYSNAVTSDFINVVNEVTHTDMNWFFDEWIYGQGYPVYASTTRTSGDTLNFYLKQEQINAPIFKMPVEFAVYSGAQETTFKFVDSLESQAVRFQYWSPVDSVVFDPGGKILKQTVAWSGPITPEPQAHSISCVNYPNPFSGTTQIQYFVGSDSRVNFKVYDVLGREVKTVDEGYRLAGSYTFVLSGKDLASGAYLVRMNTDFGSKTMKILVEK